MKRFAEIEKLGEERLILIIGPNGSGKTVFLRNLLKKIITDEEFFFSEKMLCLFNDIKKPLNQLINQELAEHTFTPTEWSWDQKQDYYDRFIKEWNRFGFHQNLYGQAFSTLSEGEKQIMLCLIFCLISPQTIVVDEPEQYLSQKSKAMILDSFADYLKNEEKTLIIATHDEEVINKLTKVTKPKLFVFDDMQFINIPFEEWETRGWEIAFGGKNVKINTEFKFI